MIAPYWTDGKRTIYHGDCREILPTLGKFDLLLTDPPYGLGDKWIGDRWATDGGKLWSDGVPDWDKSTFDGIETIEARNRIIWGGNYYSLPPVNSWLVWDKVQKHSGSEAELAWSDLSIPVRVFRMSRVEAYCGEHGKVHPTQKPLALMRWCISFAPNAKTILDPFMGSGTTLLAAKLEGLEAVGIELSEKYCEAAVKRLQQNTLDFIGQ